MNNRNCSGSLAVIPSLPFREWHPLIIYTLFVFFFLLPGAIFGADWPTYRGDNHRSGTSSESLELPLKLKWTHQATHPPQPAWPEMPAPNDYWHRLQGLSSTNTYDRVFHPVTAGKYLFYGSSADDTLYCLDASTGKSIWSFCTEAPIRLAPVVVDESIYVVSDDGCLYCLRTHNGRLLWKYRSLPDDRLLGNGRMISRWPIRSGMIIQNDAVYFSCGLFPNMGVYLVAVNARTGKEIWKRKTDSSPQGYMLASSSRLFLPTGRTALAGFDLKTGKRNGAYGAGGCFAVLIEDSLISGPNEKGQIQFSDTASRENIVSLPATEIVATPDLVYVLTSEKLYALDRKKHLQFSREIKAIEDIKPNQRSLEQKVKLRQLYLQRSQCLKWQIPRPDCFTVLKAANTLFVGGNERVFAYDAETGTSTWAAEINGKAYGLAVSNGSLVVSTDTGLIHCFTSEKIVEPIENKQPVLPQDMISPACSKWASHIVQTSQSIQGYCLVLGIDTGQLAHEIAKQSNLRIIIAEPDTEKVNQARKFLAQAGLYGKRIVIHNLDLQELPYPKYFANLIVSENALHTGSIETPAAEVFRLLRPDGGVVMMGIPDNISAKSKLSQWADKAIPNWKIKLSEKFRYGIAIRDKLPGQGEWTHTYADPANTACSQDSRIHGPVQLQWFGQPGPRFMIDRHHRNVPPLFKDGRLFIPGDNIVFAVDAYNGTVLWDRKIPESRRLGVFLDSGSMAVDEQYLYVVANSNCLALDVKTGTEKITFKMPQILNPKNCAWGYIAYTDDLLVGSGRDKGASYTKQSYGTDKSLWYKNMKVVTSRYLFVLDKHTGKSRWNYQNGTILNPTITIGSVAPPPSGVSSLHVPPLPSGVSSLHVPPPPSGVYSVPAPPRAAKLHDGVVYFIETTSPTAQSDKLGRLPIKQLFQNGEQFLVALDLKTGAIIYQKPIETHNFEEPVFLNYAHNTLILCGSRLDNKQVLYHLDAFNAESGEILWNTSFNSELATDGGHGEYNRHPTIVGQTVYAWPYAFALRTGDQIPDWKFDRRGHGCGGISASANSLFWRGQNPWMYDLQSDIGATRLTKVSRPGCWINIIPAGGMVLIPEASSGCTCGYALQTSMGFIPINN